MLKNMTVTGLTMLLIFGSVGSVFAQDEESFIQEQVVPRKDAIVLSALFPGLGQMTQGQQVKGVTFFMSEAVSLMLFLNAHENYKTKEKVYSRDRSVFNHLADTALPSDRRYSTALSSYRDLKSQNDDLDNLNTTRNVALIVAGTVYAVNLIDAIFFSQPISENMRASDDNGFKLESVMIDMNPGIMLTKRF